MGGASLWRVGEGLNNGLGDGGIYDDVVGRCQ